MANIKANNAMAKLMALSGAVTDYNNPHENIIRVTRSPSVNFCFGNGNGLPAGYTLLLYGAQKGGKSVMCYDTVGALHQDDPTAVAVKWDTELREKLQLTSQSRDMYGIDPKRYICFGTNKAEDVFDRFETDISAAIESGVNIRLAIIDSTSAIIGRRQAQQTSVNQMDIGDQAMTLQRGLQFVLPVIRKYNIGLILVTHIRAELDQDKVKRHITVKPQAANAVRHMAEYFMYCERNEYKSGMLDGHDQEMVNTNLKDIRGDKGEATGHRIQVTMKESSAGARGRRGEFIFNYTKGIVNTHEEVLKLAHARGLITNKGQFYSYGETKWRGWGNALDELEKSPELQKEILAELRRRDLAGEWPTDESNLDDKTPDIGEAADSVPVL